MSRTESLFRESAETQHKLLVAYLCVGDPSVEESIDLAHTCLEAGADILELGVPFSDPSADGPTIARASERAVARGVGLSHAFEVARAVCNRAPVVLFGYYNPLFVYGEARFGEDARTAGIDAVLVVDLPFDEASPLASAIAPIGYVPLLAPTTSQERLLTLGAHTRALRCPFAYYVSVAGITGSTTLNPVQAAARAREVSEQTSLPVVIGFGIDSAEKAREASKGAAGIVVGSAIVKRIEERASKAERKARVHAFVSELRRALDVPC